jgi:hypothetical protein
MALLADIAPAAGPYLDKLERVDMVPHAWPEEGSVKVTPIWKGVDRPQGTSVSLRPQDHQLAIRLRDLILSGNAYGTVEVRTDRNNKTYMSAEHRFSVTELEADLDCLEAKATKA